MKEYLPKMKSARYMAPKPKEPVPVVLAALHPKMLELSATQANGTHPYFVPPEFTAKARAAIGPKPMICVEQAIILSCSPSAQVGQIEVIEEERTFGSS